MDYWDRQLPSARGRELARKFLDLPPSEDHETALAILFDDAVQLGFDDCRRTAGRPILSPVIRRRKKNGQG